ncbi:hypothetical protein HDU85_007393 [Gaertneriomyces sp. JEL0708]|nr:hypothetical protein HDU85_007393 [Gaertneriomyces sp. JEL0708]
MEKNSIEHDLTGDDKTKIDLKAVKRIRFPFVIEDPNLRHTVAGACAGLISSVLVCPLDVLKIRMQNQVHQPGVTPKYHGTGSGLRIIWKEERIRGMFRGLSATTIAYIADRAIWFGAYNRLKNFLAKAAGRNPDDTGSLIHLQTTIGASLITMAVVNPLWVVRTRMMVQSNVAGQGAPWHYSGVFNAFSSIIRQEGFGALYKGIAPSLLGITHVAIQFPMYEYFKAKLKSRHATPGQDLSPQDILLASAGSKMIASIAAYPHEVLRTRLQTQHRPITHIPDHRCIGPNCPPETASSGPRYTGLLNATKVICREEGWTALYRGLSTNLIRTVPASALSLWTYEVLVQELGRGMPQ